MTAQRHQPNILIVVADTARADHLSCYGYPRKTSPWIDRIAAEGCLFETAITPAPFSPAAYASIFSNQYPHQHGVNGDTVRIWPDSMPRLARKMRDLGYYTFCVSNNDFVSEATNAHLGFDAFQGPRESWMRNKHQSVTRRVRDTIGAAPAKWLAHMGHRMFGLEKGDSADAVRSAQACIKVAGEKPFFGFVILMDPHAMYHPQRRAFVTNPESAKRFLHEINGPQMWAKLMANGTGLSPDLFQAAMDFYDAEIHHCDSAIGTLYESLAQSGKLDETLLTICADHGEAFGEHGVWGHGFCLNDCLTRVPLVVRWPGFKKKGIRSRALVTLNALHNTCLAVAQPTLHEQPGAHDLTRAADPNWAGDEAVFSEFPIQSQTLAMLRKLNPAGDFTQWAQNIYAVRTRQWRYIEYQNGACELFNLETDPGESSSVHHQQPTICHDLHTRLAAHLGRATTATACATARHPTTAVGTPPPIPTEPSPDTLDESVLNRLRALGYLD